MPPCWSAEQKATPDIAPIAAHGSQVRCWFLGLEAAVDKAPLPRQASRGSVHLLSHEMQVANRDLGTVEHVNSNGDLRIRMDSGQEVRFNVASTRTLTVVTR